MNPNYDPFIWTFLLINLSIVLLNIKKHPPEVLYKKAILKYFCAGASSMLESLFNEVAGLEVPKKVTEIDPNTGVSLWILQNF